uniref:phenylalanyl-tRNA synthetase beta subunit n=1 Tax=Glaucosphaera vacuolata TaxID=38265 RepID=UPI001FCDE093|nr:phenylalanyl-tRNA synthetase beta subunit [Glaucosphaera vacuolata]UNJ18629.1 phenylalanyl-tRNA synthetase beta subunit [Glaucosphaera vacuolata]
MQISWNWLQTLLDIQKISPEQISEKLTMAGFEVENIYKQQIGETEDVILDINPTINRPDMFSMMGVAKEIAILLDQDIVVEEPEITKVENNLLASVNAEADGCILYIGTIINNLNIKKTPEWLQQRLQASSIKPTNIIIDCINYVTLEYGQPFLVMDLDKLYKKIQYIENDNININIRQANSFEYLDIFKEPRFPLSEKNLVITYNNYLTSIAGIANSDSLIMNLDTTSILLEASIFNSRVVSMSSKACGINTEVSIRHEKGLDIKQCYSAYYRLLNLMQQLGLGDIKNNFIFNNYSISNQIINLRFTSVYQVLGPINNQFLSNSDLINLLYRLRFSVNHKENMVELQVPSHRSCDVTREIDVIEEIGRIVGFNQFIDILPSRLTRKPLSKREEFIRKIYCILNTLGLTEVVTYSLFKNGKIRITNPLTLDYAYLRNNLLQGLIKVCQHNMTQDNHTLECFEIGRVFYDHSQEIFKEHHHIAAIFGGKCIRSSWQDVPRPLTWFEAKGIIEQLFEQFPFRIQWTDIIDDDKSNLIPLFHPNRFANLYINQKKIGIFGQIHPKIIKIYNLSDLAYGFEVNIEDLYQEYYKFLEVNSFFSFYSNYPSIAKDLSIVIPIKFSLENLIQEIQDKTIGLLENIELFDEYRGVSIPEGYHSIGLRFFYRSRIKTLTLHAIEKIHEDLKNFLKDQLKLIVR